MESISGTIHVKMKEGQKALERTEWTKARECFESAVREKESPEAFELLGRAAWWLDDADAALHARETAYRLYRERGDSRSAARVAIALAYDYLSFRGEHVISNGWSRRAHRLLEGIDLTPEHGWIKAWDGNVAIEVEHDPEAALRLGKEAVQIAKKLNDFDLEMMGIALEGLALVCAGKIESGMQRLDEATAASIAGEISDLAVRTDVCCYLVTACEWVQDYNRAAQWCYTVKRTTGNGSYPLMFSLCQIHYTAVLIWRGDWDEAEDLLKEATDNLLVSRPAHAAQGLVRRADLCRRRGRYSESAQLLKKVENKPFRALGSNYHLLAKAALAYDRSQLETAENLAERYLRNTPEMSRLMIPDGLEILTSIRVELGKNEEASETASRLRSIADFTGTEPLIASANAAEGKLLMSTGNYEDACRKFEQSVELYERNGNPYKTARSRTELAQTLLHLDKKSTAKAIISSALETFDQLGAKPDKKRAESILNKIKSKNQDHSDQSHPDSFTDRELEILCEVAHGKSNPEIASEHFISVRTVERHISNIYSKLGVSGRAARATATAYAHRNGLLD
jgi:LuxR family transcriptional regulator, maltose regulon positive regulatory protein